MQWEQMCHCYLFIDFTSMVMGFDEEGGKINIHHFHSTSDRVYKRVALLYNQVQVYCFLHLQANAACRFWVARTTLHQNVLNTHNDPILGPAKVFGEPDVDLHTTWISVCEIVCLPSSR